MFEPRNLVVLASEAIQDAVDEAVARGGVSSGGDANDLVGELVRRGREQTDEVLGNLEQLLGKGIEQVARTLDEKAATARRAESVERVLRSADRARRVVGRAARRR